MLPIWTKYIIWLSMKNLRLAISSFLMSCTHIYYMYFKCGTKLLLIFLHFIWSLLLIQIKNHRHTYVQDLTVYTCTRENLHSAEHWCIHEPSIGENQTTLHLSCILARCLPLTLTQTNPGPHGLRSSQQIQIWASLELFHLLAKPILCSETSSFVYNSQWAHPCTLL